MAIQQFVKILILGLILFPLLYSATKLPQALQTEQIVVDSPLMNTLTINTTKPYLMATQTLSGTVKAIKVPLSTINRENNNFTGASISSSDDRHAREMTTLPVNSRQFFCGKTLKEVLNLLCKGQYYSATRTVFSKNNTHLLHSANTVKSDSVNNTLNRSDRITRGIVEECCHSPCTIRELRLYCLH